MAALEMTGVRKGYGDVTALDGIDLRIETGELVAVLGPNGAGKTTAFELALGLIRPDAGTIRVLGGRPGRRSVAARVGAMLQNAGLPDSVTVRELVRLIGRSYPQARPVDQVLRRVGLSARAARRLTELSGGERQRLLLALAIVGAPSLLLLDEPTAAMDVAARRAFWDEVGSSVADGTTLVFATQDLGEADEVADRVVILQNGRTLADASPGELKRLVRGKTARFATDASPDVIAGLPGGGPVELGPPLAGGVRRVSVCTDEPQQLVAAIVDGGWTLADLTVHDADLEDAFVRLTMNGARA